MRHLMPECAAFLDEVREAFGAQEVNQWIRDGINRGTFYAEEAGHTVGKPQPRGGYVQAYVPPLEVKRAAR